MKEDIASLRDLIQNNPVVVEPPYSNIDPVARHPCGGTPGWRRVAYLNMSDTRYHCPRGWRLTGYPVRTCGRASHNGWTFDPAIFQVTGEIPRLSVWSNSGVLCFLWKQSNQHYNSSYVTGVSITHGDPWQQSQLQQSLTKFVDLCCWMLWGCLPLYLSSSLYVLAITVGRYTSHILSVPRGSLNLEITVLGIWLGCWFFANDPLWNGDSISGCCRHEGLFTLWSNLLMLHWGSSLQLLLFTVLRCSNWTTGALREVKKTCKLSADLIADIRCRVLIIQLVNCWVGHVVVLIWGFCMIYKYNYTCRGSLHWWTIVVCCPKGRGEGCQIT